MSALLMGQAFYLDLPQVTKMVLLSLCNHAWDDGTRAFPSIATLAKRTNLCDRSVQNRLSEMRDMGLIRIARAADSRSKFGNEYSINVEMLDALARKTMAAEAAERRARQGVQDVPAGGPAGVQDVPAGVQDVPAGVQEITPHTSSNPSGDTPRAAREKNRAPVADPLFDRLWQAYPRRDGSNPKKPAAEKFRRAVAAGADPERMIAAAERYSAECRRKAISGTDKVAQLLTWLNQERWADDLLSPAAESSVNPRTDPSRAFNKAMKIHMARSEREGWRADATIDRIVKLVDDGRYDIADREGLAYLAANDQQRQHASRPQ